MPLEPRPERARAEKMILETQLPYDKIATDTGYSVQHIRRIAKKLAQKGATLPPEKQDKGTEEVEKITAQVPLESLEERERIQDEALTSESHIEEAKSLFLKNNIVGLFKAVNLWLPKDKRKDDEQIENLAVMWSDSLTDFMPEGIEDKYAKLGICIVVTIITFMPEIQTYILPLVKRKKVNEFPDDDLLKKSEEDKTE